MYLELRCQVGDGPETKDGKKENEDDPEEEERVLNALIPIL